MSRSYVPIGHSYSPTSPRYSSVPPNGPQPLEAWQYGSHAEKHEVPVIDLASDGEEAESVPMETTYACGLRMQLRSSARRNSNSNSNSEHNSRNKKSAKSEPVPECPVCFEPMLEQNKGVFPTCERHEFCHKCLSELNIDNGCPICRIKVQ